MSDPRRYYISHLYRCPECGRILEWQKRPDEKPDSMLLLHDPAAKCSRAGKRYYAPPVELTEFTT
jgi:hypothetical protein